MKFGRIFEMQIEGATKIHTIQSPLTCRFRVIATSLFSNGEAIFQIFNLNKEVRNDIFKDVFETFLYRPIRFSAGYIREPSIPIIFRGNVMQASSFRRGPDWITEIHGLDGGFAVENGTISLSKPSPYLVSDLFSDAVRALPRVKLGLIGTFNLTSPRGVTFSGNPWDLITRRIIPLHGQAFINKEVVNIIQQNEFIEQTGGVEQISDENGMMDTPRLQDALVKARMLFEPRLEIGQRIKLKTIESRLEGSYKILKLVHMGMVSGAVGGTMETQVTLQQPERLEAA